MPVAPDWPERMWRVDAAMAESMPGDSFYVTRKPSLTVFGEACTATFKECTPSVLTEVSTGHPSLHIVETGIHGAAGIHQLQIRRWILRQGMYGSGCAVIRRSRSVD